MFPSFGSGRDTHSLRERGWGVPIPTREQTLWYSRYRTYLYMHFVFTVMGEGHYKLYTLFVAKSQSCWRAALKMRLRKNFSTKKNLASFWSKSGSRIWIRIQIRDSNPNPKLDSDPKLTLGRIRIRNRIRKKNFGSATLHYCVLPSLSSISPNPETGHLVAKIWKEFKYKNLSFFWQLKCRIFLLNPFYVFLQIINFSMFSVVGNLRLPESLMRIRIQIQSDSGSGTKNPVQNCLKQ
jgi:hypothetical protein